MRKIIFIFLLAVVSSCAAKPKAVEKKTPPSALVTSIPFTLHDNRMLVDVFLNGQGPFVMIFDTGGVNTLTPEVQRVLELKSQGPEIDFNQEDGRRAPNTVHLKSVQVGTFKLEEQKFGVVNLSAIRKAFHFSHLDGILGYELLQQARVRLDFDHQRIQILEENAPQPQIGQALDFEFVGEKPLVRGKINDQPARILIDTGDRSNLTLFRKYAQSSQLEHLFANRDEILTGMGVAGPIRGKLASLQRIDLGGNEVDDVLARLPITKKGYFFSDSISASVGIGLLKAFNIDFDYKNHRIALERRKDFKEASTFVPVIPR